MVFLKEFFEKVDFEKNQQTTKKHENFPGGQKELIQMSTFSVSSLLKETISELAESHFRNGSPVLAACCHLAVDDTKVGC